MFIGFGALLITLPNYPLLDPLFRTRRELWSLIIVGTCGVIEGHKGSNRRELGIWHILVRF